MGRSEKLYVELPHWGDRRLRTARWKPRNGDQLMGKGVAGGAYGCGGGNATKKALRSSPDGRCWCCRSCCCCGFHSETRELRYSEILGHAAHKSLRIFVASGNNDCAPKHCAYDVWAVWPLRVAQINSSHFVFFFCCRIFWRKLNVSS